MRSGITPVIAIALLLGMTVAASGGAYTFISQAQQEAQEDASRSLSTGVAVRGLRCEDATVNVTLKNTGDASLSDSTLDAYLYQDGTLVTTSEADISSADVLEPNGLSTVSLPFVLDPGNRYTVELRFPDSDVTVESTCQAQISSLRGHWDFETRMPGTVTDAARSNDGTVQGNAKDGTLTNFDFDADSGWTDGRRGNALRFDGADDTVPVPDHADLRPDTITVSAWVRVDALGSGSQALAHKECHDGNANGWTLRFWNSNLEWKIGNKSDQASLTQSVATDTWRHVAGTYDGQIMELYVSGTSVGSRSFAPGIGNGTCNLAIGAGLDGVLDELRVWNRSFSASEVAAVADGAEPRSGLVGEWTFDEGNGTALHDTSNWVTGRTGSYALAFDGANDLVLVGNPSDLNLTQTITLSAWVRPVDRPSGGSSWKGVAGKIGSSTGYGLSLGSYGDSCSRWVFTVDGTHLPPASACETLGEWDHIVAVYDGQDLRMYQDGELEGSTSYGTGIAPSTADFRIAKSGIGNTFNGTLDDVRVYGTALSADQVAALYAATR